MSRWIQKDLCIKFEQKSIVVKHLLKMGDCPVVIDGIAVKAPSKLIVNTSPCHFRQREQRCFLCFAEFLGAAIAPKVGEVHGLRKLGLAAETSASPIHMT